MTNSPGDSVVIQNHVASAYQMENFLVAGVSLSLTEIMSSRVGKDLNGINTLTWNATAIAFDGDTGNDLIITGEYTDTLMGGEGNDTLHSNYGNDSLEGGTGNDRLDGGNNNDLLKGSAGHDTLIGAQGNDILRGDAGNDRLTGGYDADLFLYDTNAAFKTSAVGKDIITDFTSDKIVLDTTTFTALKSISGNGFSVASEFAVVTNDAAVATASALIIYSSATGNLFYNQNGTATGLGSGGQFATLTEIPNLTAADFIIQV